MWEKKFTFTRSHVNWFIISIDVWAYEWILYYFFNWCQLNCSPSICQVHYVINAENFAEFNAVFMAVQQSSLQLTTEPQLDLLYCCVTAQHKYNALYCTVNYSLDCTVNYPLYCTVNYSLYCTVNYPLYCTEIYLLYCSLNNEQCTAHCTLHTEISCKLHIHVFWTL